MSEVKIKNLDGSIDRDNLSMTANEICDGIESVFNKKSVNMCGDLFDSGKVFYLNPTEELRMGDIVKPGRKTATVLGSGDFAMDSIYHGVSDITCFDINKYQYYIAALKLKALQNMSYDEYCNFFSDSRYDSKLLNPIIYDKLKSNSTDSCLYTFMDILIKRFNDSRITIREEIKSDPFYYIVQNIKDFNSPSLEKFINSLDINFDDNTSELFLNFIFTRFGMGYISPEILSLFHGIETIKSNGSYLESGDSFNNTRDIISNSNISFVNCDVANLSSKLNNSFQSIYLSNIPEYMRGDFFVNNVIKSLMNLLDDDGIIAYCCQGVTKDDLSADKDKVIDIIEDPENEIPDMNPFNRIRLVNDVCGYQSLKKRGFDVSLDEAPSLCIDNGYHDKDTFVYVKKKKC